MSNQKAVAFEGEDAVGGLRSYEAPTLVRLSPEETETGSVILPIEILGIQGPS